MKTALGWLVRLFPEPFRERFGAAIVEHAVLDCERDARRGRLAGARFLATAFDIGRAALAERLRPRWAGVPAEKGKDHELRPERLGGELRHALRTLRRTPGFTATVVGTLGLAIGTIAGVFTVLDRVLLVAAAVRATRNGSSSSPATAPGSEHDGGVRRRGRVLSPVQGGARAWSRTWRPTAPSPTRSASATASSGSGWRAVTNSLYSTLGAQPALGRLPVAEDEERVVVISDALWRSWFGADPSVVGRTYDIAGAEPDRHRRDAAGVPVPERRRAAVGRERHPRRGPAAGPLRLRPGGADGARAPLSRPRRPS